MENEGWRSRGNFRTFSVLRHCVGAAQSFTSVALLMSHIPFSWKHLALNPFFGRMCSIGRKYFIAPTRAAGCHCWKETSAGWGSVSSWVRSSQDIHTNTLLKAAKGLGEQTHTVHRFLPSIFYTFYTCFLLPPTLLPSFLLTPEKSRRTQDTEMMAWLFSSVYMDQ